MRNYVNAPVAVLTAFLACSCSEQAPAAPAEPSAPRAAQPPQWGMVIHTGAGNFTLSVGGEGGVIGLDAHGNLMMSFNTSGMGRGYVGADGKPRIMFTVDDGK